MKERHKRIFRQFTIRTVAISMAGLLCFVGQAFAAEADFQVKWEKRCVKEETRELVKMVVPLKTAGGWSGQT
jgi:hypothetical protein